ncbi:MAG: DJ-1/PfpI family protein [Oscillospiraceae bacterium]
MVYIMLADGFEEAEAVIPADLLRRAGIETAFLSLEEREVTGARGITVTAQLTLAEADTDNMEMLVLPGGLGGVENIQMNLFAMALIQKAFDKGCYLAALCAAPTILANIGILDRRNAVCYPGMENEMGSAVVQPGVPVVVSGRIITGEALGSAFDFSLKLIEILKGKQASDTVKNAVYYRH